MKSQIRRARAVGSAGVLGGAFIVVASLQFGGVVVLGKIVTEHGLPVASFLAIRFTVAALLLFVALLGIGQPLIASPGERVPLTVLGMAGYAVEAGLFFAAVQHGSAAAVTLLFFTYPVWVALAALALGRGLPDWLLGAALFSAVGGAGLVILSSGGLDITTAGILFAFASAFTFAMYLTGADAVLKRTNSLTGAAWVSAAAGVALAVFAFSSGSAQWPAGLHQWAAVIGTAVFTAGAFVCLFAGLRRLGAVRTSIVAATEPLAASLLAVAFLNERLRPGTVGGGTLILAGAVAASLARREPPTEPPVP
ncbi:MAG TPA: DMT family transporter [Actinomycetota bacterium]